MINIKFISYFTNSAGIKEYLIKNNIITDIFNVTASVFSDFYVILDYPNNEINDYYDPSKTFIFYKKKYKDINFFNKYNFLHIAEIDNEKNIFILLKDLIDKYRSDIELKNIYCINLNNRLDRKKHIIQEFDNQLLDINFYHTNKHKNPEIGCLESHINIIKLAKKNNFEYVFIIEDDCKFLDPIILKNIPNNWQMLYLGGCVKNIIEHYNITWKRVESWYAHAYIIHSSIYDKIIELEIEFKSIKTIDEIYCELIHPNYNCYMLFPYIATQMQSYSDIEFSNIDRNEKIKVFNEICSKYLPIWIDDLFSINNINHIKINKNNIISNNIIYNSMNRKLSSIGIINNESFIIDSLFDIKIDNIPTNWDVLYLNYESYIKTKVKYKNWYNINSITNPSVFILRYSTFNDLIKFDDIDHDLLISKFNCYVLDNNINNINSTIDITYPFVSIITPTYNRLNTFKLAMHNFLNTSYPKDKLEWIIIDDGTVPVNPLIPKDPRIKYYYFDSEKKTELYNNMVEKLSIFKNKKKKQKLLGIHKKFFYNNRLPIGMKRNIGVSLASSNYIVHFDDDDYYPPDSISIRIKKLLENDNIECIACTAIPSFNVNKYISMINSPPISLTLEKQISEATLCYTKEFWNKQKYYNQSIGSEAEEFIYKRTNKCKVIDWNNVIVSLLHKNNSSSRTDNITQSPNGWHFDKISDELFIMITSIDDYKLKNN